MYPTITIYINHSAIKGYHYFKVRPHHELALKVVKERDNSSDPHTMLVVIPVLKDIPEKLHKVVVHEAKDGYKEQTIAKNTSKTVENFLNMGNYLTYFALYHF